MEDGMSAPERWIVVPNWREFQHYKDRDPRWIKAYTRLLSDAEYLALSFRLRGILHSIWLLYAASDGLVSGSSPAQLGRMLGADAVRTRDIESLNHAGFIRFSASKPLALRYQAASPEVEVETYKAFLPSNGVEGPATEAGRLEDSELDVLAELQALAAVQDMPA